MSTVPQRLRRVAKVLRLLEAGSSSEESRFNATRKLWAMQNSLLSARKNLQEYFAMMDQAHSKPATGAKEIEEQLNALMSKLEGLI